jgi:hypothetical protein
MKREILKDIRNIPKSLTGISDWVVFKFFSFSYVSAFSTFSKSDKKRIDIK